MWNGNSVSVVTGLTILNLLRREPVMRVRFKKLFRSFFTGPFVAFGVLLYRTVTAEKHHEPETTTVAVFFPARCCFPNHRSLHTI